MSKLGKRSIQIPKDTQVKVESGKLTLSGPKGKRELTINDKIFSAQVSESQLSLKPIKQSELINKTWGTTRSIINNAIIGVSTGHQKILELTGVGFRASLKGKSLNLQIGFSHDVSYEIPEDVKVVVEKQTTITISGIDKEKVGKVASEIRFLKPVEPYKGKGIKEKGQYVLKKEGKKK
tara:strand:+ start:292 stop:828 length:537 start_codon:yes stop_codon:yes gene_type:complete